MKTSAPTQRKWMAKPSTAKTMAKVKMASGTAPSWPS